MKKNMIIKTIAFQIIFLGVIGNIICDELKTKFEGPIGVLAPTTTTYGKNTKRFEKIEYFLNYLRSKISKYYKEL